MTFGAHITNGMICLAFTFGLAACDKKPKDRTKLNLEAYKFIEAVGPLEVHYILQQGNLYIPSDCHRIWDNKDPIGNFVTGNRVAVRLTNDICDDWTDDLITLFASYGIKSDSDVFKAPGFTMSYVKALPEYMKSWERTQVYWKRPENQRACIGMPKEPQQYFPQLNVLGSMFKISNWHELGKPNQPLDLQKGLATIDPELREFARRTMAEAKPSDLVKKHCVPGPR